MGEAIRAEPSWSTASPLSFLADSSSSNEPAFIWLQVDLIPADALHRPKSPAVAGEPFMEATGKQVT